MIQSRGTGPQNRLSSLEPRLSPIMKYSFGGIVMVLGRSHPIPLPHGLMKSSLATTPLTTGWPSLTLSSSPGPATIRLMKLVSDSSGAERPHGALVPSPVFGSAHLGPPPTAPTGG